jgi:sodium-dependent dicarboxylate transporter 2/3/5
MAGLVLGPILFIILFNMAPSEGLSAEGIAVAAVATWMAVWWMTEAVPLAVTALLPLVLFPVFGVSPIDRTAQSYAHPLIFLFLGGFILARAMEQWNLHKRLAFFVLRLGGSEPAAIIGSIMVATAFLSMWISNTATTMVMLPIGQALVVTMRNNAGLDSGQKTDDFGAALMLGIAFAATIGGIGSLIGTPPNALFAGFMRESYGVEIGFAQWMLLGVPIVLVLLPLTWILLTRFAFRIAGAGTGQRQADIFEHLEVPGPMSRGEVMVAVLMVTVATLWILRPLLIHLFPGLGLSDAGIAVTAAVALFVIPAGTTGSERLLRWQEAARIRWDVLILFGGGLALAGAIADSGLAAWIGSTAGVFEDRLSRRTGQ